MSSVPRPRGTILLFGAVALIVVLLMGAAPANAVASASCNDFALAGSLEPALCIFQLDCQAPSLCLYEGTISVRHVGVIESGFVESTQPGTLYSDGTPATIIDCGITISPPEQCGFSFQVLITPSTPATNIRCGAYGPAVLISVNCAANLILVL